MDTDAKKLREFVVAPTAIAAGELAGCQMMLDLHLEKDYWLGTYEADLQQSLQHYVHPGMVAYDVGANIGYISLMLARRTGDTGRVFSFEALPANVARLRQNLALNACANGVEVISAAVVDAAHPVRFMVHASTSMGKAAGSAGRSDEKYSSEIEVPGVQLDEFVFAGARPAPDFIKMDIEGGEVLALQGMHRILSECQPVVFIELHGQEAARAAWDALTSAGYQIRQMGAGEGIVTSVEDLDWKAYIIGVKEKNP